MKYYPIVKRVLEKNPKSRDCDLSLIFRTYSEIEDLCAHDSFLSVLNKIRDKKLPSFDTVTRIGRKVKEENPELRGNNYIDRKTVKVEYVQGLMKLGL